MGEATKDKPAKAQGQAEARADLALGRTPAGPAGITRR